MDNKKEEKGEKVTKRRKIITLCGSTRFKKDFEHWNKELTLQGHIVISVGIFGHRGKDPRFWENKELLDKIHLDKIRLADEIFVINPGGYIGESTKKEIEFAKSIGKIVKYTEPPKSY